VSGLLPVDFSHGIGTSNHHVLA